jgi:hypothetical protein
MSDPRRTAAERIHAAIAAGGDGAFCEALERLAEETGRNILRFTAQTLRGRTGGRRAIDDRRALQRIEAWPADHKAAAVGIIAREMAGPDASPKRVKAIERRLRRKLTKKNGQKASVRVPTALRAKP